MVHCNVGKRGWMSGIGGCPNVGGICIGCTMPGFPDKFMPFMDEPRGAKLSTTAVATYGRTIRALRGFTKASMGHEPEWRHRRPELTTGYIPRPRPRISNATATGSIMSEACGRARSSSRCPGTRSPGSSAAWASTPRSTSPTRRVAECHSTSSIFRGYSVFMKGKDPRDAHFITSRICGICGDNHATCAVYAQNMAFGVRPPALAEWIINLGEAAEYMFDHNLYQDNLVGVDYCERMVKETNPSVLDRAERTSAPHASIHGYRTIADIMRSLNPFSGSAFYREALQMSRLTREMFCLMEGRHVHPSTLYPGGVGTVATTQLFTDYLVRLMKYVEFMKKVVPLHDDLFDFFYEALPGYEEVGRRRILLGCWGSFNDPDDCDYTYANMADWGRKMFVTPGVIVDGELVTTDLVEINLGMRILLGSSFYDDWQGGETFVKSDPLGNPIHQQHPWNQTTTPRPQKRDFADKYTWVMSPRWLDERTGEHLALDTGGGPAGPALDDGACGPGRLRRHPVHRPAASEIALPRSASLPAVEFEWKIPRWSNVLERNRARTYFQAYAAAAALHFVERGSPRSTPAGPTPGADFKVPDEAIGCGFHEAVRGVLSHHMVIRDGKIANYHPYPPTPWNASPRDSFGTPGPYEDAIQGTPLFEENGPDDFKGIDIMRTVRSFDPCLPCGVHMYLGAGKEIQVRHTPAFGAQPGPRDRRR